MQRISSAIGRVGYAIRTLLVRYVSIDYIEHDLFVTKKKRKKNDKIKIKTKKKILKKKK